MVRRGRNADSLEIAKTRQGSNEQKEKKWLKKLKDGQCGTYDKHSCGRAWKEWVKCSLATLARRRRLAPRRRRFLASSSDIPQIIETRLALYPSDPPHIKALRLG